VPGAGGKSEAEPPISSSARASDPEKHPADTKFFGPRNFPSQATPISRQVGQALERADMLTSKDARIRFALAKSSRPVELSPDGARAR